MELTLANAGAATAADPLDVFGEHPWDVAQRQQDEANANWWSENRTRADEAFLDPQKAFPDMEQGFADSVDTQRKLAAVDDLMRLHNKGEDPPADDYGRYLMRERIAHLEFNGEGIESDEALFAVGQKYAQKGVEEREFSKKLTAAVAKDAVLEVGDGSALTEFMKTAPTIKGYDPDKAADYAERIAEDRAKVRERMAPFRQQLAAVWEARGNLGKVKPEVLAGLRDEDMPEFLKSLRLLAETLSDEEKETFLAGMRKDFARTWDSAVGRAGDTLGDYATGIPSFAFEPGDIAQEGVSPETRTAFEKSSNRAHEVRRIMTSTYDPIDYVKGWGWAQKIPGVTTTSLAYAVPVVGTGFMATSMQGMAQEKSYLRARDHGMSEADAASYSSAIAPAVMIPQAILEKIGIGIWTRKLPMLNRLLTKMDDAIVNRGLRGIVKTGVIGGAETGVEVLQDLTEVAITDIAGALNSDLPDVDWNTELKGAWNSIPEIFGSMVVLSMFGAAGGLNTEARAAAFQSASDRQLTAAGLTPDAIQNIRNAQGPASTVAAVQAGWQTRNPDSPEAKAASEEEAAALARARAAGEALRSSGALPSIVVGKDGFTVLDGETKDEVGTAKTMGEAWRIAQAHSDFLADLQGDAVAYMATLLESADFVSKLDPATKTELDLGTVMDRALLEATKPEMAARFALQVAMKEQAAGGTGEISYAINGWSETEIRDNLRQTTNRIFSGASALTVFHEFTHGKRREARAAGRITRGDELSFIRAIDTVLGTRKTKEGERMAFLQEGLTDDQVTEEMIDEAMSEIMEMEILRSREGGTKRKIAQRPGVVGVPSGFITRNLKAIGRLAPEATRKFSAFIEAVRGHFGTAMARALALKKAEREGKFDSDSYDAFLAKMMGLDLQDDHNARVDEEAARIYQGDPRLSPEAFAALGDPTQEVDGDDIPFSLSRARGKNAIQFATPIPTPLGNVVGYEWQSKVIEQDSGGVEGIVLKRVSDWDKAVTNAETGRDIVHHFLIEKPDGTTSTVSLESTLKQAGAEAKNIKGIVTAARRLPMLEAEMEQLTEDIAEYEKRSDAEERRVSYLNPPEPSWQESEWESVRSRGQANMMVGDVFVSVEDKSKPFPRDRIEYGRSQWKRSQMDVGMKVPDYERKTALNRLIRKDREKLKAANVTDFRSPASAAPAFSIGRATVQVSNDTRAFQGAEGSPSVIGPAAFSIRAWHGTPHKVDKFTTEKIGTGEGLQAYGWGLYFADRQGVAKSYMTAGQRESLVGLLTLIQKESAYFVESKTWLGKQLTREESDERLAKSFFKKYLKQFPDTKVTEELVLDVIKNGIANKSELTGNLYRVTLKVENEDLLDWDKPLSEQSEKVRAALGRMGFEVKDVKMPDEPDARWGQIGVDTAGKTFTYDQAASSIYLSLKSGNPQEASAALAAAGIRGIRYLDGISRGKGEGSYNYVIFSDADIEIVEENGTPVDLGAFSLAPSGAYTKGGMWYHGGPMELEGGRLKHGGKSGSDSGGIFLSDDSPEGQRYSAGYGRALYRMTLDLDEEEVFNLSNPDHRERVRPVETEDGNGEDFLMNAETSVRDGSLDWSAVDPDVLQAAGFKAAILMERPAGFLGKNPIRSVAVFDAASIGEPELVPQAEYDQIQRDAMNAAKEWGGNTALSLAPSRALDLMQMNALDRVRNPRRRAEIFTRMSREFQRLKLAAERLEIVSGTKRLRKSLLKEAAMREAKAREDLEADVYSRFWQIFADEDLVKIKSQPGHAFLADPDSPLRGRLMSRTAAMKHRAELFGEDYKGGEWDGSDGLSRALFGGTRMPDQAAKEMYDEGLIKSDDVNEMWALLHSEQAQVAGMKEQLAKAQEQLREARIAAKEEANAWLKHAAKGQQETFNPREEILRMVASLEAILRPLPSPVRVKVGGYQQMIRIAGTDGQLKFLREQISKADKELEKWMRETIGQEFRELMEKTKPERDEAGKRPKGKIGADIHDIFRSIDAAIYLDGAETEAEATRLETLADAETTTDTQRAHLMMEANLVRLTGNWAKADSARREAALEAATNAYYGGYMQAQMKAAGRRARNDFRRADLKAATGKAGERMERVAAEVAGLGTKLGRAKQAVFSLFSFDQMLALVFGTDSETAKLFTDWELRAANAKEDAMQRSHDAVETLLTDLAGGELAGEKLRHKLATERSVTWTDHKGRPQDATEMEAVSLTLMWRQEDGKRHMEGIIEEQPDGSTEVLSEWHWREEDIEALEKQLSKEAKAIRMFLTDSYAAEYDRINAVFSDLYGVNMPRHKDYSPIKVAPSHAAGGQTADPVSGTMQGPGLTPGSLKNRSHSAVAEPARIDALQHFVAHTKQMEHFIAYAAFSTELMAVVNNREVGNTIEAKAGKEAVNVIRGWADYFAQGGTRDAAAHLAASHWFQRGLDRISQMALVGRASVLAIQSVQLGAALYQMPAGSYMKRLAKLSTGQLGWGKAIRSEYIQRRLSQMPPAVQQAMAGLAAGSPSRIKHATAKLGRLISGADALFTAGTYAIIYDYQLTAAKRMGIPNPEAFAEQETIRLTDQVAQPMRAGARSMMEVTSTNPAFRMMWAFASEPRQKIAMAVHQAMTKKGAGRFRAAGVTWLVSGMAASILRAAVRDIRDDGDDDEVFDEKNWSPERLILASLAGPLGGFPLIGNEIESALYASAGEYIPGGSLLSGPTKAVGVVRKHIQGKGEWDDAIKDTETILGATGYAFPTAAAATSWVHISRDVEGIIRNMTEDD